MVDPINVFAFLSGYLSSGRFRDLNGWLTRRCFGLMVPYWIVIVPVLLMNYVEQYKVVPAHDYIITFFVGNMFLANPVYQISWYITFTLICCAYAYIETYIQREGALLLYYVAGFSAFTFLPFIHKSPILFAFFLLGLMMARRAKKKVESAPSSVSNLAYRIFDIQKYAYVFFLLHGGVLLFFLKKMHFSPAPLFVASFIVTALLSVLVFNLSQPIEGYAITRIQKLRLRGVMGAFTK